MGKINLRRVLNEGNARKDNKTYKRNLGWVLKKIEWHKKEGYTSLEIEDHFTPAEKNWLRKNTECEISEYSDDLGYYVVFKW